MSGQFRAGLVLLAALAVAGVAAPWLTSAGWLKDPLAIDMAVTLRPPAPGRWLGTDDVGRDVLSRLLHGARPSILVALIATAVALALGVPAGALAGLRGGVWDLTITRLMEATTALPSLIFILLIVSLTIGSGGTTPALAIPAAAIGATRWAVIARYVRGGVRQGQVEDWAAAAIALGAGRGRLLARHLLPAAIAPALTSAAFGAGSAVLLESALSFLGLGTRLPDPSWGKMVFDASETPGAWWLLAAPGLAIAALVIGFNLVAEGVRERAAGRSAVEARAGEPASV